MFSPSRTISQRPLKLRQTRLAVRVITRAPVDCETDSSLELQTRQLTLIDVVKSLEEYINNEDPKIRSRAISYLNAVITALPANYLMRQQIQVLNQFLCVRIEDGGAIDGLSKLQSLDRFNNDMAQVVVRA
jgi:DNA repair/transcription protein MET18/MMS19